MDKIIIFSHESDIDGLGSVILGKLAFGEIDYVLCPNINILQAEFSKLIENKNLYNYDKIYITDLTLYAPAADIVKNDAILSDKVLVFDHHKSAIDDGYDTYDFENIIDVDENGKKRCGTDLFYEHLLLEKYIVGTPAIDEFVELTRLEDTWEWKKNGRGIKAHDLAILFNAIGIEQYINIIYTKLLYESDFNFTTDEMNIIENRKNEYLDLLKQTWEEVEFFKDESNNKYASLYANYELRNELSEYAKSLKIDDLKYLIIVALEKGEFGQKSYRSIEENFDVGKIAKSHGGNGHVGAAAVNITEEQRNHALSLMKTNKRDSLKYLVDNNYTD